MIKYPISFKSKSQSESGIQSLWNIESQDFKSTCAVPPEFEGPGGAISPEDLFGLALANCFVASFKVYAEKSKIHYKDISAQAELIADLDEQKKPMMKKCIIHVQINGAENPDRVKTIADKVISSGFILRSVKTEIVFNLEIN